MTMNSLSSLARPCVALALVLASTLTVAPCAAQKKGTTARTLESGGVEREFLLHIPRRYKQASKKAPVPLVVMLHGRTGSGKLAARPYYGWKRLADKEDFVVVFPTALGRPTSWKGAWRGKPTEDSVFLAELIELLKGELKIDGRRVFMTGHSSGGFMSFSFAATHGDLVAAIAPVAGLAVDRSKPSSPVSLISFHGMDDDVVPYEKSKWGTPNAPESAALFAKHNGCGDVERTELNKGKVHLDQWKDGEAGTEVAFYSIEGFGHGWPQGDRKSVAATELIWAFFEAHPRKPRGAGDEDASDAGGKSGRSRRKR